MHELARPTRSQGSTDARVDHDRSTAEPSARLRPSPVSALASQGETVGADEPGRPLPPLLRAGLEAMSGLALGDVRVHDESPRPAELGALAMATGDQVHLGPRQHEHLAHEAWHVVQQRQGRVAAHAPGAVVADPVLEVEAEQLGRLASTGFRPRARSGARPGRGAGPEATQLLTDDEVRRMFAHLQGNPWLGHGLPTAPQLVAMARFTLDELQTLGGLPQCAAGGWAALADLGAIPATRSVADIAAVAQTVHTGATPTVATVVRLLTRFSRPELATLGTLPQCAAGGWASLDALVGVPAARPFTDITDLATSRAGGVLPAVGTIVALLRTFTYHDIFSIVTSPANAGSFQNNWADLEHLAEIRDTPANLVTLGQNANLATHPWLEHQVHALTLLHHGEAKQDVNGVLDRQRSCWSWATQAFNARVPDLDSFLWTYLGMRTDYPPAYGMTRTHAQARDAATNDPNLRGWLDTSAVRLQGIINQFAAGHSPHRERDAQRAMMVIMLEASGFTVLPPGTPSRWSIGMHERQTKISWEHWWVQTRTGGVIETFPFRDPNVLNAQGVPGDGGGGTLAFTGNQNSGNPATDFTHLVPVQDLLPDQKTIIKRALTRAGRQFTDDLP
ncbi:eCIS core domain-containing protein [Cellulomonas palmilytica]|uniref:eCIS core domain-containing protein n=1 Tax=Cellulomonas palmilytica TaxID=2608402 RepID=UPI001F1C1168|nr:DUF4157 domain-containing protein [Cellulomonas palmilytica]UJP40301.1 DUF4157 domain-containing protein [Cellulomonas palmilytica]